MAKPKLIPIDTTVPEQYRNLTDEEYPALVLGGYGAVDAYRRGGRTTLLAYLREVNPRLFTPGPLDVFKEIKPCPR